MSLYDDTRRISLETVPDSMRGLTFDRPLTPVECVDLFCTPIRSEPARKERALYDLGEAFFFTVNGERIEGWRWGSGPTVVFTHGWSGHAAQTMNFIEGCLVEGFSAVAFDAPAHGASHGTQCTGLKVANCLLALDELDGPFAGLVSYSFGTAGSTMALSRGLRAARVVYVAPMCWIDLRVEQFAKICGITDFDAFWAEVDRRWGEGRLRQYAGDALGRSVKAPLLAIHDAGDTDLDVRHARCLVAAWPHARLVETQGLGHARILRDQEVGRLAAEFLKGS